MDSQHAATSAGVSFEDQLRAISQAIRSLGDEISRSKDEDAIDDMKTQRQHLYVALETIRHARSMRDSLSALLNTPQDSRGIK